MPYCWIAQGKLFIRSDAGEVREHESEFGREAVQRGEEQKRQNGWKAKPGAQEGLFSRGMLWGGQAQGQGGAPNAPPRFLTAIVGKDPDELFYVLGMSRSCGLFRYHYSSNTEYRLFHRPEFIQHGLAYDPHQPGLVVSLSGEDGSAALWELSAEGKPVRKLTDGDVIDSAPAISRKQPSTILYESTGIGRNQEGHVAGLAASALMSLDRADGSVRTVKEDPSRDYLQPSQDSAGTIYSIRRPHHNGAHISPWALAKDFALFPLRLGHACFGFLNTFSLMFGKKPLRTAGAQRPFEARRVLIKGHWLDTEQAARKPAEQRSLVPASWELVAIAADGQERVLARKVAAYWVNADGTILTTDGFTIYKLVDGRKDVLNRGELIEQIIAST